NVTVGGVRLLERVSAALGPAEITLVCTGPFTPAELAILPGQIAIPDLASDYGGPLAAVAAAADWCARKPAPPDLLVTAAVDTAFLPDDFIARMLAALPDDAPAVLAHWRGQDYPTNAVWRVPALASLPAAVLGGAAPRSLRRLAAGLGAAAFDWPDQGQDNPFSNVNTPEDLAEARQRATHRN
ncbi:MAG TPA: NTP transferase domain-containing protein, partial [Devosia sp.]|nr:NTP transferase domain-containing protein [Devosia sp.]